MGMNYDFRNIRALVVDDSRFMTRVVSQVLQAVGVGTVATAHSGYEGFEYAKDFCPDLIVSDWDMDDGAGPELVDMIRNRSDSPCPYVSIIMLTGFAEKRRVLAARNFGITEFLTKPISTKALYSRLVSLVERPRPFIRVEDDYFGPDRRRMVAEFRGADRRGTEYAEI